MDHKHPPGIFAHPRIHRACPEQPLHKAKGLSIHPLLAYLSYQASGRRSFSNYPPCLQPPTSIRVTQGAYQTFSGVSAIVSILLHLSSPCLAWLLVMVLSRSLQRNSVGFR